MSVVRSTCVSARHLRFVCSSTRVTVTSWRRRELAIFLFPGIVIFWVNVCFTHLPRGDFDMFGVRVRSRFTFHGRRMNYLYFPELYAVRVICNFHRIYYSQPISTSRLLRSAARRSADATRQWYEVFFSSLYKFSVNSVNSLLLGLAGMGTE